MQDDLLTSEIKKNNNSFFVSKELEDVLLSENLISKSNCLLNVDNVSIECSVLSYKVCSKKIVINIQTSNKRFTGFKLESFKDIMFSSGGIIQLQNKILSYKEYLNNNSCYNIKLKIKLDCEEKDGVWVW